VTAGRFATQDRLEQDFELTADVLTADFTNTVLFCERAREHLLAAGGGTLCVSARWPVIAGASPSSSTVLPASV
jgi:hypothetical protein